MNAVDGLFLAFGVIGGVFLAFAAVGAIGQAVFSLAVRVQGGKGKRGRRNLY